MLDDMSGGNTNLHRLVSSIQKGLKPLSKNKFTKSELISLIEKNICILEESENHGINHATLMGMLNKIIKENKLRFSADTYLKNLIDANILKLGIEVQCSNCLRFSWYPMNNISYDLKCPKCVENFRLLQESSENIECSYFSVGSFRQPNLGGGAYSVLLTIRFFPVYWKHI
jgi:hypothetical protein